MHQNQEPENNYRESEHVPVWLMDGGSLPSRETHMGSEKKNTESDMSHCH